MSEYRYLVSHGPEDEDWDSFLARTPGGHHVQSSLWAQVKSTLGWKAVRLVVKQDERIVGGVQISIRRLLPGGTVGVVSKGPTLFSEDPWLAEFVMDALLRIAKEHDVSCLVVQPPNNGESLTPLMREKGFRPLPLEVAPTATIQIDLTRDLDDILAGMKKQARRDIRHGLNSGVRVREGTEDDLVTFWHLLQATSQRQKWSTYSADYFAAILRIYGQRGLAKLFMAEYEGKAISSQILIGFGDTVIAKNSGWSGEYKNLAPNNVLEWISIQWAKAEGYHYYDLEGITRKLAVARLCGECDENEGEDNWCCYKFKYGGDVKLFPKAHIHFLNRMGNRMFKSLLSVMERQPFTQNLMDLIRLH